MKCAQFIVIAGIGLCSFTDGFIFGQMSGMLDDLLQKDGHNNMHLNEDQVSLIASMINITCFIGVAFVTVITEIFGRKKSVIIMAIPVLVCWLMVYFAQDIYTLLASRIIVGLFYGGMLLLTYINIGEYVTPRKRSLYLNLVGNMTLYAGVAAGHILSIFFHWKLVALMGVIPNSLCIIIPCFWVESPSWLATKGRFEECKTAFRTLHASSANSRSELETLIAEQRKSIKELPLNTNSLLLLLKKFTEALKQRYFWKLTLFTFVLVVYRVAAGRILLSTLGLTILQEVTGSKDILYFTIMLDGFAIFGAGIACVLISHYRMRSVLFVSGTLSNSVQLIFALFVYLLPNNDPYIAWTKVCLLSLYYITVIAGPYSVLETLLTEILPLEIKSAFAFFLGALSGIVHFLSIQFAAKMTASIGYHGIFLLHAIIVFICLGYLYKFLPETKGRTLQEIERYFKYNSFEYHESYETEKELVTDLGI